MNRFLSLFCFLILIVSIVACNNEKKQNAISEMQQTEFDTLPRVTGIGGIFFFTDSTKATKEWYHQNLGIEVNEYGATFESRNANRPGEINYLQWSPFKNGNKYFEPSTKPFMINYRVQHIEKLVDKLRANGVTILDTIQTYDYGKFVHILDREGAKIELWEPYDEALTKLGGKTNK